MALWIEPAEIDVPLPLRAAVGGNPLVAETLARRGIRTSTTAMAFLDPAAHEPAPPTDLPGMQAAVDRLRLAIQRRERICVWGDFDADGQTSTSVLLEVLRSLGADVTYRVPTRSEGHGLHAHIVEQLITDGAHLILTCDTGVTAHDAVARANALGAEVIITDHHVLGETLPPALAVINPHRLPPDHPMGTLPGVGVAYELARALNPDAADNTLDLVALGTVADVATLTGDARYHVQRGLEALRETKRLGLQAIYQAAKLRPEGITEEHISFVLGPRLNSLGRLADAAHGVELLTLTDRIRARSLAAEAEGLNGQRQWLTKQVTDAALAQIERDPALADHNVLVLSHPTWPPGIVGIVAGRLARRLGRPVVLIAAPPGETARGSGRSVPGVDLVSALTACASLLKGFGGHAMAAGFGMESDGIPALRLALSRAVGAQVETIPEPTVQIDAYVELPDLTLDLVAEIDRLAPFGPGNRPLTLAVRDVRVKSQATIGRTAEHLRLTVEDSEGHSETVFWWQGAGWALPRGQFDLALTIRATDFRGVADTQVQWVDARVTEPETVEVRAAPAIEVHDYRSVADPAAVLRELAERDELQVWSEGQGPNEVKVQTRQQLGPGRELVIWTLPPGPQILQAAISRVQPECVHLFAHDPDLDDTAAFLRRLAGLARYALEDRSGQVDLEGAAAAMAHRVGTVRAGLRWLAAAGQICIEEEGKAEVILSGGSGEGDTEALADARAGLEPLLAETNAYRRYLAAVPPAAIVPAA